MIGYVSGKTVLIRKAEKSHDAFAKIAQYFRTIFAAAVDIQLYATPSLCEGFDWHYDLEDVFVIQSSGEKVFNLRGNKADLDTLKAKPVEIPKTTDLLEQQMDTTELKFHLRAGDLLYIPAGYWHKARSIRDSFHISIGILNGTIPTPPASLCSI